MSFMERSNWRDPNKVRKYRIFIPLVIGLLIAAFAIVEVHPKVLFTAFGTTAACPSPSASTTASGTPVTGKPVTGKPPGSGRWHRRGHKGAESVDGGATPAASPSAAPAAASAPNAPAGGPNASAGGPSAPATTQVSTNPSTGASTAPSASTNPSTGASTTAVPSSSSSGTPSTSPSACPTTSTPAAADPNVNCTITVPANPLSAQGLATPYTLTATDPAMGPCNEANVNQSAFVQATVIDPATGKLSVYDPLVIDKGTKAAAAPVVPTLPAGAVVGIWFGFDATNLTLQSAGGSLNQGRCVNGLNGSVFGQYAYCNAPAFFTAANRAIKAGMLTVPALGTANDGMPCLSTRDFALIDQDQSDNVTTQYLATNNGTIAQNTAANKAQLAGAATLANPSDNALLDVFLDPPMGCTPWTAPDLANNGAMVTSLALDEIQANADQKAPSALVPLNDPMTLVGTATSNQKTNLYRAGVDQAPLSAGQTPKQYCTNMDTIQGARLQKDMTLLNGQASPMPAAASTLFNFVGMRLQQSFGNLNCQNFGLTNPVSKLTMTGDVVTAVTFAQPGAPASPGAPSTGPNPSGSPTTPASPGKGRHHHRPPRR
jgi:hypothetical protein